MWNADTVEAIAAWYATSKGQFALAQERRLMQRLTSHWPRRGHSLAAIGCGTGVSLEMLWEHGFDVAGVDFCPENLTRCFERIGSRAELYLGKSDCLPFDDGTFDYTAVCSLLEHEEHPEQILAEAVRIARRGVVILFANPWSLFHLEQRVHQRLFMGISAGRVRRIVQQLVPEAHIMSRSVLLGPSCSWKNSWVWNVLNQTAFPLPLGARSGLCVDFSPLVPPTPLLLKAKDKALEVCSELRGNAEPVSGRVMHYHNIFKKTE